MKQSPNFVNHILLTHFQRIFLKPLKFSFAIVTFNSEYNHFTRSKHFPLILSLSRIPTGINDAAH